VRLALRRFEITRLALATWLGRFNLRAQIAFLPRLTRYMGARWRAGRGVGRGWPLQDARHGS
jgi:hypothetical protein